MSTTTDFSRHSAVIRVPRLVTVQPVHVNPALLSGDRAQIDAFADRMLALERQREADAASELVTEGQRFPSKPSPHDD